MKTVGIIRRIDDLGRIIIPREIRKQLSINEGCPLEITVAENGNVILKKVDTKKSLIDDVRSLEETLDWYSGSLELGDIDGIREAIEAIKSYIKNAN